MNGTNGTYLDYRNGHGHPRHDDDLAALAPPPLRVPPPPPRSPARNSPRSSMNNMTPPASNYSNQAPAYSFPTNSPQTQTQTLLLVLASATSLQTQQLLERILTQQGSSVGVVSVLAQTEQLAKQTKMDAYTVAGRLQRQLAVYTSVVDVTRSEELRAGIESLVQGPLGGVVCCLGTPAGVSGVGADVLELETGEVERGLQSSIIAVHAIARATMPLLTNSTAVLGLGIDSPASAPTPTPQPSSSQPPFFLLDSETSIAALSSLPGSTQEALLRSIARSPLARGVTVGYAQEVLPPLTPVRHPSRPGSVAISRHASGSFSNLTVDTSAGALNGAGGSFTEEEGEVEDAESGAESPTKLWNLWAMQNELEED